MHLHYTVQTMFAYTHLKYVRCLCMYMCFLLFLILAVCGVMQYD